MNKNISNIPNINTILKITLATMLLVMIGTSAQASLQIVTIDVVPDNEGSVQVWKNYPDTFMGFVTTTKNFDFDTSDSIAIVPFDKMGSQYKFVRQCDDVECITGVYIGTLYPDKLMYKVTVYYEIPKTTVTPLPTVTPTPTPTSSLHIVSLKLSGISDSINVNVRTTGTGKLGIDLDSKPLVSTINVIKDGDTETKISTSPGEHLICVRDVDNDKEIKCQSIELIKPTLSTASTSGSTPSTTQTPTPTPTPTQTTENLKTSSSDTPKLDDGSLFIDSDPSKANIYLNDKLYGITPKIIDIQPGGYVLRVTKDGYVDYTKKVIVSESKTEEITVHLVIDESINQTNQSAMMESGNQINKDTNEKFIDNMTLIVIISVIAIACIVCVAIYSRKPTYINYTSHPNEKSMIVVKRIDR